MHLVRCFTVSPPAISNLFEGGFLWCFVGVVCFVWGLVCNVWFFGLCFPHGSEITTVVCEVVCEVEGPSEPSWRARHGRKKNSMLEQAYHTVKNVLRVTREGELVGGELSLNVLESLPPHWPLAKLTLRLKFGVQRLDRLVAGYLMELRATRSNVYQCRKEISSFAKVLMVRVATYLAKLIASLLQPVLYHPLMDLTEENTLALLSSGFWVRPVYEELLHAASRFNLSQEAEHKRPTSNLVKIASHVKETVRDSRNQHDQHTTMTEWLEADCPVDYLNVWFPAHWAPLVFKELQDREAKHRSKHNLWFDFPPFPTGSKKLIHERANARKSRDVQFQLGAMDRAGNLAHLYWQAQS